MEYTSSYTGAQIDASVGKFEGSYLKGIHAIQLNTIGDLSGYGGFIDFHYNGSSNYTSRIIESSSGFLTFNSNIYVEGASMFATNRGNVGIGTTQPKFKLDVNGNMRVLGYITTPLRVYFGAHNYADQNGLIYLFAPDSSLFPTLKMEMEPSQGENLRVDIYLDGLDMVFENKGNDITAAYYFDNDVYAHSFQQTSDMRKKNVIGNITIDINDIANAPLFKFAWKDERKTGEHVGSSAQYWQEILPEVISAGKDPMQSLSMDYSTAALASAITTAKSVVDHEERIIALEKENALLKKEIEAIKAA